jgi:O-antigen/teichoic acid export membrane protein
LELQKIIKSSVAFILPALINLLSLIGFTRMLTLENYGQLSLAWVSIEFVQIVFFSWVNMSVMRFYNLKEKFLSISAGLQINLLLTIFIIVAAVLVYFLKGLLSITDPIFIILILLGVIGRGLTYYIQDVYRIYFTNLKAYTIVSVLLNATYFIPALIFLFIYKRVSINMLLAVQVIGLMIFLLILFATKYSMTISLIRQIRQKKIYEDFLRYGLPLIVSFISVSMFVRIDRYIIQYNVGLEALGGYSAAFSLSNLAISSFFLALTLPTYPEIMRKFSEGDEQGAKSIYKKNGTIILLVSIPSVILSCILSKFLCILFFGEEKGLKVATIFPWVVISTFMFNYRVHYFDQLFQFYKKTKVAMYVGIVIGAAHVIVGFFFSDFWGAKGVSYSGIILNGLTIAYTIYYNKYVLKKTAFKI